MFVLWSLLLLFTGRPALRDEIAAFLLFAVAIAMKPQSGFVAARDAVRALPALPATGGPRPELIDGALQHRPDRGRLARRLGSSRGSPFGLGPVSLVRFYNDAAVGLPVTSANAFNLWGVVGFWRNDSVGRPRRLLRRHPCASTSAMLLFAVATSWCSGARTAAIERGANEARALTVAAASVALLAFALLTRMHERYMFLALAMLRAARLHAAAAARATPALSALFVLNLWYPYAFFNRVWWHVQGFHYNPWFDWLFGGFVDRHVAEEGLVARRHRDRARRRVARSPLGRRRSRRCRKRLRRRPRRRAASPRRLPPSWRAGGPHRPRSSPRATRDGLALGRRSRSVALACLFVPRRPPRRDEPGREPQRQLLPPADGALGGRADRRGPRAARRLVPRPLARLVVLPPLPEPPAHPHRLRRPHHRRGRPDDVPLDPVPAARALADRGLSRARGCSAGAAGPPRPRRLSRRSSSARPATATSTAATPGRATASTRSSGRCGCCRSPGG